MRNVTDSENRHDGPDTQTAKTVGRVLLLIGTAAMVCALIFPDDAQILAWCLAAIGVAAAGLLAIAVATWIEARR